MTRARYDTDGLEPSQEIQDAVDKLATFLENDGWTVEVNVELDGPEYRVGCVGLGRFMVPYLWDWFEGKTDEQLGAEAKAYQERHGKPEVALTDGDYLTGVTVADVRKLASSMYDWSGVPELTDDELRTIGQALERSIWQSHDIGDDMIILVENAILARPESEQPKEK